MPGEIESLPTNEIINKKAFFKQKLNSLKVPICIRDPGRRERWVSDLKQKINRCECELLNRANEALENQKI
jgi:hypothetical protein